MPFPMKSISRVLSLAGRILIVAYTISTVPALAGAASVEQGVGLTPAHFPRHSGEDVAEMSASRENSGKSPCCILTGGIQSTPI